MMTLVTMLSTPLSRLHIPIGGSHTRFFSLFAAILSEILCHVHTHPNSYKSPPALAISCPFPLLCTITGLKTDCSSSLLHALLEKLSTSRSRYLTAIGCCATGDGLDALSGVLAQWGDCATSAPAGVLATISGTVSTLPRLLVGDAIAAYHLAGDALSQWSHTGQPLCVRSMGLLPLLAGSVCLR